MEFDPLTLLVLKFRGRSVAVFRHHCLDHESIIAVAQRTFQPLQGIPPEDIVLLASIPGYPDPDQGEVEISKDIWLAVSNVVRSVTIALESEMRSSNECNSPVLPDYKEARAETSADTDTGEPPPAPTPPPRMPSPPRWYHLRHPQREQSSDGLQAGPAPRDPTPITISPRTRIRTATVRKPIIYLFPPTTLPDVTVELQLTPSWRFSAVYPPPWATFPSDGHQTAQTLSWEISAEPNGTLVNKTTGTEMSYLYWEANVDSQIATPNTSRATTPVGDIETFDPSRPSVNPGNSILLPIRDVPGYLDAALKALALHTEARTSFITYWLPDLLNHKYVALRFLPQASYEQAAQMRITPTPDIVTRVFMLFRGVPQGDLGLWEQAATRATAEDGGPTFWARVVGVDLARASDRSLFSVLEWGGMETK